MIFELFVNEQRSQKIVFLSRKIEETKRLPSLAYQIVYIRLLSKRQLVTHFECFAFARKYGTVHTYWGNQRKPLPRRVRFPRGGIFGTSAPRGFQPRQEIHNTYLYLLKLLLSHSPQPLNDLSNSSVLWHDRAVGPCPPANSAADVSMNTWWTGVLAARETVGSHAADRNNYHSAAITLDSNFIVPKVTVGKI